MYVCFVADGVSKLGFEISPTCIILIKQGSYYLTLPVARCCMVKNTANGLGSRFFVYESVH
jgi:hypothetical protein